ncbi:peptidoglycan-binding protein [Bacillus sp. FJAT-50079]|uniref:peptidoglycan-binding domain-containing protein n=1 Tax=Bacillus sp. FJAT-50079 TaxID=2833577 RepID=UPI001BCA0422|nr:peptidoglycan-binding protein [Bacillus sp. FJAT-50079]MBS4206726.1 peptidoglycan-binding protein [Bacillus sp. FJAT-50079]
MIRNFIKIISPFVIIAGFFFIMSNLKHVEILTFAEEKSIEEYQNMMKQAEVLGEDVEEKQTVSEQDITPLVQAVSQTGAVAKGASGEYVKIIQRTLGIEEDGIFDEQTEQAVKDFQLRIGQEVDGMVGIQTMEGLIEQLNIR